MDPVTSAVDLIDTILTRILQCCSCDPEALHHPFSLDLQVTPCSEDQICAALSLVEQ
uniref:Uncharacterized protein n=1 Tax=Tetraselmis sp. GSL018 TaxID=582737 RepID=A0A061RJ91_9CHLO